MQRLHGLDLLRSLLILEGIFYHSSLVISPTHWIYSSPNYNSYILGLFFQFFHLFRMETFFLLAGFFASMIIKKKGVEYYIKDRIKRLIIPFFLSIFLVCLPQYLFIANFIISINNINIPDLISHLWFMNILIIFIIFHILSINKSIKLKKYLLFIALSLLIYKPMSYFIPELFPNFTYTIFLATNFFKYIGFYLFGVFVFFNFEITNNHTQRYKYIYFFLSICLSAFLLFRTYLVWDEIWVNTDPFIRNFYGALIDPFLIFFNALFISLILFYYFKKINYTNKCIKIIINSSLAIYILHQPIIIVSAYFLDNRGLNLFLFFSIICFISFAVPLFLYAIFNKNKFFKIIFGMKINNKVYNKEEVFNKNYNR